LGDADITWGLGFEGTIVYRFIPSLGVYAGWSWNNFASDKTLKEVNWILMKQAIALVYNSYSQ
jgi:hypothetical protein